MPKVGDVVLYTAFGRTINALVLAVRTGISSHEGSTGEPALTLAFVDPPRNAVAGGRKEIGPLAERPWEIPTVHVENDVVHASHEFSADYKHSKGLSTPAHIATERGHGEWQEATVIPTVDVGTEAELTDVAAAEATDVSV